MWKRMRRMGRIERWTRKGDRIMEGHSLPRLLSIRSPVFSCSLSLSLSLPASASPWPEPCWVSYCYSLAMLGATYDSVQRAHRTTVSASTHTNSQTHTKTVAHRSQPQHTNCCTPSLLPNNQSKNTKKSKPSTLEQWHHLLLGRNLLDTGSPGADILVTMETASLWGEDEGESRVRLEIREREES